MIKHEIDIHQNYNKRQLEVLSLIQLLGGATWRAALLGWRSTGRTHALALPSWPSSLSTFKTTSEMGGIPKWLMKVIPPHCAGCLFGAMTRDPWHTKASGCLRQPNGKNQGWLGCSADGCLTDRYCAATMLWKVSRVFSSCIPWWVYRQSRQLLQKKAFELFATNNGVESNNVVIKLADKACTDHRKQHSVPTILRLVTPNH